MNRHVKKQIFKWLIKPVLMLIASVFYDRRYLTGRHFEKEFGGWVWVFKGIFHQKLFGFNASVPWPMHPFVRISNPANITFHVDDLHVFQTYGTYFQNFSGHIYLGRGVYIAPNVGLITANHDLYDLDKHLPGKDVRIGDHCWLGMAAIIMPGVELGERTVVAAGAIVTKSFPAGWCVIGGNPARVIKQLEKPA